MRLMIRCSLMLHARATWVTAAILALLSACQTSPEGSPPGSVSGDSSAADSNPAGSNLSSPVSMAPEEPYVDRGVCPFECCTYQEWVARDTLRVYRAERDSSETAFVLAPGERFDGLTGNVHVDRAGVVVARDTVRVDAASPEGGAVYLPGDTVYVLSPLGEGFFHLWHEGAVAEGYGFWAMNPMEAIGPQGELLREPEWAWWAQVRNAEGETGWLNMSRLGGQIGGVDACGGG